MKKKLYISIAFSALGGVVALWALVALPKAGPTVIEPNVRAECIHELQGYLGRKNEAFEQDLRRLISPFSEDRTGLTGEFGPDPFAQSEARILASIAATVVPVGVVFGPQGGVLYLDSGQELSQGADWVASYGGIAYVVCLQSVTAEGFKLKLGDATLECPFSFIDTHSAYIEH